jgi:diguanylate cyclase (GGDEF)-like protein
MALAHAERNKRMVGVMFLDLDKFKNINDSLGHNIGDLLLQEVAKRLTCCCRHEDTVSRFGDDEFTIILPEIKEEEHIIEVVQRIIKSFSKPFAIKEHVIISSASIGITLYPTDGEDVATLVKNADIAMYRAKEQGRNTYELYTKAMHDLIVERVELENNLWKALKNDEFKVYYQPQINIKTGFISGTEALVRWQRSENDLVMPDKFIPVAEDTGLIFPLGERVLRTACRQTKAWHDAGFGSLSVAVNLSAKQFQDDHLVQLVRDILAETGLAPEFLCLEITENTVMRDIDTAVKILSALEDIGIHLSIDDFGTGYSSLSYLKHFPLHEIKIDKSFVQELPCHQGDIAIAKAILSLAHSLKLKVLAEGVETQAQLEFMRMNSCDGIQGYLFSKPIQPEEIMTFLKEGKKL